MAKRRILKKLLRVLIVVAVLAIAIFAFSLFVMARKARSTSVSSTRANQLINFWLPTSMDSKRPSRRRMLPKSRNSIQTTMPLPGAAIGR